MRKGDCFSIGDHDFYIAGMRDSNFVRVKDDHNNTVQGCKKWIDNEIEYQDATICQLY